MSAASLEKLKTRIIMSNLIIDLEGSSSDVLVMKGFGFLFVNFHVIPYDNILFIL